MRAILVASSPIDDFEKLYIPQENDLIIGIDGGCAKIQNYPIDLAYGDFDSLINFDVLKNIKQIKKYPIQKDETDLELAIMDLKEQVTEFVIYNATGGRLDHFLAVMKLLERYGELNIKVVDRNNSIQVLQPGEWVLHQDNYRYFSLIPIHETILSISGALYNVEHQKVNSTDIYTVSNQFIKDTKVTIHQGLMYLILAKDE